MDISPLQSLQQDYAQTPGTKLQGKSAQAIVHGRCIVAGEEIQDNAKIQAVLAQLEDEIMACAPLKERTGFFQKCVRAMLARLKIQPKPLTSRKISEAIGRLIEEIRHQHEHQKPSRSREESQ